MWGAGGVPQPPAGMYGNVGMMPQQQQPMAQVNTSGQKHDVFVGNLAFNTTEEQLLTAFSEIGRVLHVRLVTDAETNKPRGFAFVEFADPQAALSAIRNMNDYELNGRRLRVNFSNSSHLEALATKLGMDLSSSTGNQRSSGQSQQPRTAAVGTNAVAESLKSMSKAEMYDVVAKLKEIADKDADEARRLLSGHPQLPEALLFCMSKLDMVKTPLATAGGIMPTAAAVPAAAPVRAADPRTRTDPRQAAAAAATSSPAAAPHAPPPARVDPRQRADPRQRVAQPPAAAVPPPPMPPAAPQYGAPPPMQPAPQPGVANLDPALVQQVMSLTPAQIQQLPPDKQQSILQLRQQITGGRM